MSQFPSLLLDSEGDIYHSCLENYSGAKYKIFASYLCIFSVLNLNELIFQLDDFQPDLLAVVLTIYLYAITGREQSSTRMKYFNTGSHVHSKILYPPLKRFYFEKVTADYYAITIEISEAKPSD